MPRKRCAAHAGFDVARIHDIEREVKHDVIAFTTAVAENMAAAGQADASRWLHYGLTSNDIVDTAQALVLQQASALLLDGARSAARRLWTAALTNLSTRRRSAAPTASMPSRSPSA